MNFETNNKSLLNINKTENTNFPLNSNINFRQNPINSLRNKARKSSTAKQLKQIILLNKNNITEKQEKISDSNIDSFNSGENILTEKENNPINFNTFYKPETNSLKNNSKSSITNKFLKPIPRNNMDIKNNTRKALFKSEINGKIIDINNNINNNNDRKTYFFADTSSNSIRRKRNRISLRNKSFDTNFYMNVNINKKKIKEKQEKKNPLLIPKEDMIFEEMKNYKCFEYYSKDSLFKTGVPFIYINMNMNTTKKPPPKKRSINPYQINITNDIKQFIKYDSAFLSKNKNISFSNDKKKEILNNIYRVPTSPDMYEKINSIKAKKDKKKLKNYQFNFLKMVKHNITEKNYEELKERFNEIRQIAEGKYKTNFKYIKELEKDEEKVIENVNKIYKTFEKYFRSINNKNYFENPERTKLRLPSIKFEKVINDDSLSLIEKKIAKNKKFNIINLSNLSPHKNMNRTSIKFNQKRLSSFANFTSNKKIMLTASKRISKFNFLNK